MNILLSDHMCAMCDGRLPQWRRSVASGKGSERKRLVVTGRAGVSPFHRAAAAAAGRPHRQRYVQPVGAGQSKGPAAYFVSCQREARVCASVRLVMDK